MMQHAYQALVMSFNIACIMSALHVNSLSASFGITQIDPSVLTHPLFVELACAEMSDADKATSRGIIRDWVSSTDMHVCSPTQFRPTHHEGILHAAARAGHAVLLPFLLKRNLEVDDRNNVGKTPLFLAAERGHCLAVRALIAAGADMSIPDNHGVTSLHVAASCGHVAMVRLLIEKGADVSVLDRRKRTPLFGAARLGSISIVRLLLSNDVRIVDSPADHDETPLHTAAAHGHEQVVRLLVEHGGAVLDLKDSHGMTPLMRATEACADLDRGLVSVEEAAQESLQRSSGFSSFEYNEHERRLAHYRAVRDTVQYLFTVSDLALKSRTGTSASEYVRECSERFFDPADWGEPFYLAFKTATLCLDQDEWSLPVDLQKLIMLFAWSNAHQNCYKTMKQGLCLNEEGTAHDE